MSLSKMQWPASAVLISAFAAAALAGGLADVKHVVLFMQENRAFDHYYGTMAGVRGFGDPNVQVNADGRTTFQQLVPASFSNKTTTMYTNTSDEADRSLTMWHQTYLGGLWEEAMQCSGGGSNSWKANHLALNGGLNNQWAVDNTYMSWSYYDRADIPYHFALSEAYTLCDMYQEGVIASTWPNRVHWMTGTINAPGGPTTPDQGGTVIDNNGTPGCDVGVHLGCFPFYWKTFAEYLEDAGVSWRVWQDEDNFSDNPLAYFNQFIEADATSNLTLKGNSFPGLDAFYETARNGTLPEVSWIVGPAELSEHTPYMPKDGAWLIQQVVDAVTQGESANDTVLFVMYDETGGWGDHVVPFHSPNGTAAEWMEDPYGGGYYYTGPGFRLPMHIVSPWTRGNKVFTEHADHASQLLFLETWLAERGYSGIEEAAMTPWRRAHMSNLVNAFDWDHPDYSVPVLPTTETPSTSSSGAYNGVSVCEAILGFQPEPMPPYGPDNANQNMSTLVEEGFKEVTGYLTEGRYLVFEQDGLAMANLGSGSAVPSDFTLTAATADHADKAQRWVVHEQDGAPVVGGQINHGTYFLTSAVDGRYIASHTSLSTSASGAETYNITFLGNGQGYSLQKENGKYLGVQDGEVYITSAVSGWNAYSVSYLS